MTHNQSFLCLCLLRNEMFERLRAGFLLASSLTSCHGIIHWCDLHLCHSVFWVSRLQLQPQCYLPCLQLFWAVRIRCGVLHRSMALCQFIPSDSSLIKISIILKPGCPKRAIICMLFQQALEELFYFHPTRVPVLICSWYEPSGISMHNLNSSPSGYL